VLVNSRSASATVFIVAALFPPLLVLAARAASGRSRRQSVGFCPAASIVRARRPGSEAADVTLRLRDFKLALGSETSIDILGMAR